ncbi:hypothetical protein SAMN04487866_1423 [Thermoactinomyces sp. DSM 45891]|uniref:hypothetical protein n=1 Tax=Thermoactinomyces sp. DSM 45891 TaxID=1761907 RepID=UPI00091FDC35|nr:hypothetical protein [Thermoactinomyces sp. DSM 45891]SFX84413.1 hypothetical protein SAMN04487866_1423 [Thermoactinomyces sp. DSM 45891]
MYLQLVGGGGGVIVADGSTACAGAAPGFVAASWGVGATRGGAVNLGQDISSLINMFSRGRGSGWTPGSKLPSQGNVSAGVEGAPQVSAGQQGKHVPGHPNYKSGKSAWPEGADGSVKIHDFGYPVGSNGETRVKVHQGKGVIHGYPVE